MRVLPPVVDCASLGSLTPDRSGKSSCFPVGASPAEPSVPREHDRLRPRPDTELVEQVRQVIPDGLLADAEPLGDLRVAQPLPEQRQRLALAGRELLERI